MQRTNRGENVIWVNLAIERQHLIVIKRIKKKVLFHFQQFLPQSVSRAAEFTKNTEHSNTTDCSWDLGSIWLWLECREDRDFTENWKRERVFENVCVDILYLTATTEKERGDWGGAPEFLHNITLTARSYMWDRGLTNNDKGIVTQMGWGDLNLKGRTLCQ